ncbi:MAG: ABC transporter ATP-binding protein [Chloroflexi bacterium]|nr:ABC transporter ATP-binding protein [Chloroflexota bacterium]MBK6711695.1 ABC transporter ATP-binding protein [Chloroflexota bacterium]MBK7177092.1 ABC transporter ATP-binding protein [Chloroflexota bacterium]MBK7920143.1 ABC transporter ATP-binding protein [Chloroflexota bacterium]MBK8931518.1 ABC transporter ATP-binding protein [Chloroflexota bacterium]
MAILEIRDVTSGYGEVQILWGTSLSMEEGRLTSLVGANGAGKTTLLRTVMGSIKPWQGSVWFNGQDISHLPTHAKAEMGVVLVPEGRQLFTDMSVEENLEMGASPKRARAHVARNLERVYEMFPRLKERRAQKSGTMSGGEQQMLAVARGIMAEPIVLMIDELSLGLAPVLVLDLFQSLKKLKDAGLTMMLVEQNVQMALAISDYGYVLAQGRVEIDGPSRELAENEHVRSAYLGH